MNLEELKKTFLGNVIVPGDALYDQVKNSFMYQGAPAVVFQPKTAQAIADAIVYARDTKLVLSIRSGGHSGAPFSTNTGGVVIDLSLINAVEIVDTQKNLVRVGAGARWGDVAKALYEKGLALSSGDTKSVGVGGLTTGAGIGWMVRKYGLAIDSLVAAELVTADGKILNLSETENSDLFWAIRGGGSNFGVVTQFEFTAHRETDVFAGTILYGVDDVAKVLTGWRDHMRTVDENLSTIVNIMPSFGPENPPSIMVMVCYADTDEAGAKAAIEPLKQLGTPLKVDVKKKAYAEVLEEAHPPQGMKVVVKNTFVEDLSDASIGVIAEQQKQNPGFFLQIRSLGGAVNRTASGACAFAFRNSEAMLLSPVFVPPTASDADIDKAFGSWKLISKFGNGAYCNFMSTTTPEDVAMIYPKDTYERLAKIKKQYDPENVFNQNHNIKPA